jgi:hypothetical protein
MKTYTLTELLAMTREEVEAIAEEKRILFTKSMSKKKIAEAIEFQAFRDKRHAENRKHIHEIF